MARNDEIDAHSELSALQIAGLAILGSTIAAVGTLLLLRRLGIVGRSAVRRMSPEAAGSQADQHAGVPDHFSEDIVLPGITFTGAEVEAQDNTFGRSPEGV